MHLIRFPLSSVFDLEFLQFLVRSLFQQLRGGGFSPTVQKHAHLFNRRHLMTHDCVLSKPLTWWILMNANERKLNPNKDRKCRFLSYLGWSDVLGCVSYAVTHHGDPSHLGVDRTLRSSLSVLIRFLTDEHVPPQTGTRYRCIFLLPDVEFNN